MLTDFQIGLFSLPILLLLIFLRIPLAVALFLVGLAGTYIVSGDARMMNSQLKIFTFGVFTNYSLSIIPLFLLMGEFAAKGGMSAALFRAASAWLGHRRGGIAMAAIGASAGFGAICGSSLATATSIGKIAYPELKRAGYSSAFATGTLAAGGTLGILIPPSVVLVIYAILAEENIERLFIAAFIPGILAMLGYMLTASLYARFVAGAEQQRQKPPLAQRLACALDTLPVIVIFIIVIGGIYGGLFSPTAAAAVGAAATGFLACYSKQLSFAQLKESLLSVGQTSAMIFFIILAAGFYNSFLSAALVPQTLAEIITAAALNPWLVLIAMLLLYLVLGTVMDSLAMIFLTAPIFVPIITQLDFGLTPSEVGIWFGILVLMSAEIGLITPPVGLNLFVINALARDVNIAETYRGVLPFVISDIIRISILVAFPSITLLLVRWLY
ncbi:MAG: TRAP transporter large permease [Proteobacteria bacterium]|nr:TRAP transporter large permease [Pseudomonadota bacterium]